MIYNLEWNKYISTFRGKNNYSVMKRKNDSLHHVTATPQGTCMPCGAIHIFIHSSIISIPMTPSPSPFRTSPIPMAPLPSMSCCNIDNKDMYILMLMLT